MPAPEYALPTLSVGGELDGVVRVSRLAEARYTQKALPQRKVKLVLGMSHRDILDSVPAAVAEADLESEIGSDEARDTKAAITTDYLVEQETFSESSGLLAPVSKKATRCAAVMGL